MTLLKLLVAVGFMVIAPWPLNLIALGLLMIYSVGAIIWRYWE